MSVRVKFWVKQDWGLSLELGEISIEIEVKKPVILADRNQSKIHLEHKYKKVMHRLSILQLTHKILLYKYLLTTLTIKIHLNSNNYM